MEWTDAGSNRMTEWTKDPPPSNSTSAILGCAKVGYARLGDTSECGNVCEPPPVVEVVVSGSIDVVVTVN